MGRYSRYTPDGSMEWHCGRCDCWSYTAFLVRSSSNRPQLLVCPDCLPDFRFSCAPFDSALIMNARAHSVQSRSQELRRYRLAKLWLSNHGDGSTIETEEKDAPDE